jgi:hypothetical protein
MHALLGLEVQSKVSGQAGKIRRPAPPASFAHNGLAGGSNPPSPTRHSHKLYISCGTRNDSRDFKGLGEVLRHIPVSVRRRLGASKRLSGRLSLAPKIPFLAPHRRCAENAFTRARRPGLVLCKFVLLSHHQRSFDMCVL